MFGENKKIKQNFKRVVFAFMAFALLVSVFSGLNCPKNSFADEQENQSQSNASVASDGMKLLNPGKLSVAVAPPYPPFVELQGNDLVGYEPDLYAEIGKDLGLEIEEKIMNFDAIIAAVSSGSQCDVAMSGISINAERKKVVDFTDSYYNSDLSLIVGENSSINVSNAKFKIYDPELSFAVQSGSTSEMYVRENFPKAKVVTFGTENDGFAAVNANQVDIVCSTKAVAADLMKSNFSNMVDVMDIATNEEYGIAVSKDNPVLTQKLNDSIAKLSANGTIAKLQAKYGISSGAGVMQNNLQTVKCSAKTNSLASNTVIGDLDTSITWEGQAASNETIQGISFNIPEGLDFDTQYITATMLTGDNYLTRVKLKNSVDYNNGVLNVSFTDKSQLMPGGYFRIEIPNVVFPEYGGDYYFNGSYKLTDGTVKEINDSPSISVEEMDGFKRFAYDINESEPVKFWNSNKFLNLFFNPSLLLLSLPIIFAGFLMALATVICAFPIAIPFGMLIALMRISKSKFLRGVSSFYVNIVRGTPLFLQIYIAFFGLPLAGIDIPNFPLGLIVLCLNSGAYVCEIFRAGIQSIPKGQFEASRSLGLNRSKTMFYIIMPQAFRQCIPTLTSEFILLYKDTSLLASVGVMEVVMFAKTIVAATGSITPYIVAALFYLVITIPMSNLVGRIEKRFTRSKNSRKELVKPKKDKKVDDSVMAGGKVFPSNVNFSDNESVGGVSPSQMGSF